jgi:hypothetical protein
MRAVLVYRERTDYSRTVADYLRDFERQTGHKLETLNPDTEDGMQFCSLYDIVEYPTVIATSDDGVMQKTWRNLPLPTIMELSYYVQ